MWRHTLEPGLVQNSKFRLITLLEMIESIFQLNLDVNLDVIYILNSQFPSLNSMHKILNILKTYFAVGKLEPILFIRNRYPTLQINLIQLEIIEDPFLALNCWRLNSKIGQIFATTHT